jgi:hypothetical protein
MAKEIKLAGFKYSKILVERNDELKGELKITPNINIKSIEKFKSDNSKQELLLVDFKFGIDYTSLGKVELEGKMFLSLDQKTMKDTLESWNDKKMDSEMNLIILNAIMQKASIKALELEEEMNLPPHVQLPRLQLGKKE